MNVALFDEKPIDFLESESMAKHRWTISLKIDSDDGDGFAGSRSATSMKVQSSWDSDDGSVAVNECIATDMAGLLRGAMNSGCLIAPSTLAETAKAFEAMCNSY